MPIEYVLHRYSARVDTRYLLVGPDGGQIVDVHEMLRQWEGEDSLDIHGVYLITPEGAVISVGIENDDPSYGDLNRKVPGYIFNISEFREDGEGPLLEHIEYHDNVDRIDRDDLDEEIRHHYVYVNGFPEMVAA